MSVSLVVTYGDSSMDRYSQQLGERLPVPKVHVRVRGMSAEAFGVPLLSARTLRAAAADLRFVRALRRHGGPLHFPSHHLARYGPSLGVPYVLTVHDLIRWFDLMGLGPLIQRPNARDRLLLGLDYEGFRKAAGLIAISETTKRDLAGYLGLPPHRIAVAPDGIDHDVFRPVGRRLFEFPYLIYVGTEQPRKNLETLLGSLTRLERMPGTAGLHLVKVGEAGPRAAVDRPRTLRAVEALGLADRVHLVGRLEDADLAAAYSGAACAAFPSRYEGFCLPVLEAMACGCPVVASTAGALPEVVGDAGLTADPQDPGELAERIFEVVAGGAAEDLRARGLRRAAEFSWERTAADTLRAYDTFLPAAASP